MYLSSQTAFPVKTLRIYQRVIIEMLNTQYSYFLFVGNNNISIFLKIDGWHRSTSDLNASIVRNVSDKVLSAHSNIVCSASAAATSAGYRENKPI
jgi:hypothetical protein